jgi:cellulose synthase/poly-beta-1,6-N-acetylglucosamine synthase-like glycosyltransferase
MSEAAGSSETTRALETVRPPGAAWTLLGIPGAVLLFTAAFGFADLVNTVGVSIQLLFVAFFARHLAFAVSAMRTAPSDLAATDVDTGFRPSVSVLVACKDEEEVVEELVESLLALDYPSERLELVIVDDGSSDRTGELLDDLAANSPRLRRVDRPAGAGGGKSAALNAGLDTASGEVIVVFDADHRPRRDVLKRLVRHFEDPGVAAVQGRCEIRNRDESPLARLVAIDYLAGYLVNEYGRQSLFQLPANGGANCAVRASVLRAAGGWNPASVTEDTDLTLRLVLGGSRLRYDATAVDEEQAVATLGRYWQQRYRWARGHQQVWRDFRRAVWRTPSMSLVEKIETTMFLLVFHIPVCSAAGLGILGIWISGVAQPIDPLAVFVLWTLLFLGPLSELAGGLLVARSARRDALALALFLPLFFISIALCTKAWFDGVLGRGYTWAKTGRSPREPQTVAV